MEVVEDVVIVGAGVAGLTTAVGLHRLGIRSLVLESSDHLRATGFAFATWPNAWKALDAVGVGESLRQQHGRLLGAITTSIASGRPIAERKFNDATGTQNEVRCVHRKVLLETLEKELPSGTVRFSSKVVLIEVSGYLKLVHLADGSVLKAKVLIGCDGVNSSVAKWLGFKEPVFDGRSAIRGCAYYEHSHGFEHKSLRCFGEGVRSGFIPCNDKSIYWFFTFSLSNQDTAEMEENPAKIKQYVLSKLGKLPDSLRAIIHNTELDNLVLSPLRFRHPWEIIWGNITKSGVCIAGDAFHPMTPDIGQGACSALEDGVILARCLGKALTNKKLTKSEETWDKEKEEQRTVELALENYARERRWRAFSLITIAYTMGHIQQSNGKIVSFLRDKVLAPVLAGPMLRVTSFDCGTLAAS